MWVATRCVSRPTISTTAVTRCMSQLHMPPRLESSTEVRMRPVVGAEPVPVAGGGEVGAGEEGAGEDGPATWALI